MEQTGLPLETLLYSAGIVFLAELGDKTMLATMCMSAQYKRPSVVLLATMLALASSTVIAVVIGVLMADELPTDLIAHLSGAMFLAMGFYTLIRRESEGATDCSNAGTFLSMFSLVFLSELGDKTQIACLALAARSALPVFVFSGAIIGFFIVNAMGAAAGGRVARAVPIGLIRKVTSLVFIAFGVLIFSGIL
jgi:putative Ca2+/H+ antiporter (TMEM165/GDT1 family)